MTYGQILLMLILTQLFTNCLWITFAPNFRSSGWRVIAIIVLAIYGVLVVTSAGLFINSHW